MLSSRQDFCRKKDQMYTTRITILAELKYSMRGGYSTERYAKHDLSRSYLY